MTRLSRLAAATALSSSLAVPLAAFAQQTAAPPPPAAAPAARRPATPGPAIAPAPGSEPNAAPAAAPGADAAAAAPATADPPARAGRIARLAGTVSFHGPGADHWEAATLNFPVTDGDALWTEPNATAAMDVAGSRLTLAGGTELDVEKLDATTLTLTAPQGEVYLRLADLAPNETFTLVTPRGTVSIAQAGRYEVAAGDQSAPTTVTVLDGQAQVAAEGVNLTVQPGQTATVTGDHTFQGSVGAQKVDAFLAVIEKQPVPSQAALPPAVQAMPGAEDSEPGRQLAAVARLRQRLVSAGRRRLGAVPRRPLGLRGALGLDLGRRRRVGLRAVPLRALGGDREPLGLGAGVRGARLGGAGRLLCRPGLCAGAGELRRLRRGRGHRHRLRRLGRLVPAGLGRAVPSGADGGGRGYLEGINRGYVRDVSIVHTNITINNFANRHATTVVPAGVMTGSRPVAAAAHTATAQQLASMHPVATSPVRPAATTAGVTPAVAHSMGLPAAPAGAGAKAAPGPAIAAGAGAHAATPGLAAGPHAAGAHAAGAPGPAITPHAAGTAPTPALRSATPAAGATTHATTPAAGTAHATTPSGGTPHTTTPQVGHPTPQVGHPTPQVSHPTPQVSHPTPQVHSAPAPQPHAAPQVHAPAPHTRAAPPQHAPAPHQNNCKPGQKC